MAQNRGKQFESVIKEAFEKVDGVSIDRLNDNTAGFKGIAGICDFIVYKKPYEYYIECKSVHGNTLSIHGNDPKHKYGNITNTQWEGLLEKSKIDGVFAGIICWFVDKNVTYYFDIQFLYALRTQGYKSVRYDSKADSYPPNYADDSELFQLSGKKKRVFFDYDMNQFLEDLSNADYN